jgi:hypothetical protein
MKSMRFIAQCRHAVVLGRNRLKRAIERTISLLSRGHNKLIFAALSNYRLACLMRDAANSACNFIEMEWFNMGVSAPSLLRDIGINQW